MVGGGWSIRVQGMVIVSQGSWAGGRFGLVKQVQGPSQVLSRNTHPVSVLPYRHEPVQGIGPGVVVGGGKQQSQVGRGGGLVSGVGVVDAEGGEGGVKGN